MEKKFSIISVYNNRKILNECLLESLRKQTIPFELILLDNTQGKFESAAKALNYGGKRAKGKYLMFVHQDVELGSASWLENVEKILDNIPDLGVAGVAGMSEEGKSFDEKQRGYISDCGRIYGKPFKEPQKVQTLDECLLIIPKEIFNKIQFDDNIFDGWHCYGSDYCLSLKKEGLKCYVIPAFIYHRFLRVNVDKLFKYLERLYNKHKKKYKYIYTTAWGELSGLKIKLQKLQNVLMFLRQFYKKIFPDWIDYLKRELSNCHTVLDIGCGYNSQIQYCKVSFSVGVEMFEPYLLESRKKSIHNKYIKADIRKIEFKPKSFDAILCSEIIEHLTKEEGYELIEKMQRWAKKKIIITTPNGYLWQDGYDKNPLQEHKSGWNARELKQLGFKVFGINGWKKLRGYEGKIKYKPEFFWQKVSELSQKLVYKIPKLAFQLFAVKHIKNATKSFHNNS